MDLKQLNIPKHVAENKKKKKKPNEAEENENIFILTAILLNEHRNAQGKIAKLDIDELLLFDEEAHIQYSDWVNSGAIEQVPTTLRIFSIFCERIPSFAVFSTSSVLYTVFCYSSHYVSCFSYTTYFHIQIPNYLGDKHREEVIDRPARWDEVIFKCIPLQEGEEDTTEVRPQCISLFLPLT